MMGSLRKKGWERQYKSDRLACLDRMQNRCYSVSAAIKAPRAKAARRSSVMTKIGAVVNHFDSSRAYG
jgi:hypothetical protein